MNTTWYTYMLKCSDNSLYTGVTTDIHRRVNEHNCKKGGSYTRARLPAKLIYKEPHHSKSQALKREHEIKRWSHKRKLAFVTMCGKLS